MRFILPVGCVAVIFSAFSHASPPEYTLPISPSCEPWVKNAKLAVGASRDQRLSQCDDLIRATESDLQWHIRNTEVSCRNSGGRMVWGAAVQNPSPDCERRPTSIRVMRTQAGVCVTGQNQCRTIESLINSAECAEGSDSIWRDRLESEMHNPSEQACEDAAVKVQTNLDSQIEQRTQDCQTAGGVLRVQRKSSPDHNRCDGVAPDSSWVVSRSAVVNCCKGGN